MSMLRQSYRGFQIEVSATRAARALNWIGHYEITGSRHGFASGSLSGPHTTERAAIENALQVAKDFVDSVAE